jgi:cysteine synthase A
MVKDKAENILELIGSTPMVKLNRLVDADMADIYAKLESFNPGGSIKDRICLAMIEDAEKKGLLKPGSTIIEPTSGNTGIGLAMVAAVKGYKLILTMPDAMSMERVFILQSFGAEVVLTPGEEGMLGAIQKAKELNKQIPESFMPQQFNNPANPEIHRRTTAREIIKTMGKTLDAFVAGVGTGGTLTGVGEVLKEHYPQIKIVAVEPADSPVISNGAAGSHRIQGIGPGFIPKVLNVDLIDQVITVTDENAYDTTKRLAQEEGLFMGISAGAAACAALTVSRVLGRGKTVAVIFPDTGERYYSTRQQFEE